MNRANWFKIHSWVGFNLTLLMSFVLITGTLAVVSNELDWLTNPAKRVSPSSALETDWSAIYTSVVQRLPNKKILMLNAPIDPWFSAEVSFYKQKNQLHRAFFHPGNGDYLGEGRWFNWQRFFRMTHRHLMMPTQVGISIVGLLGVLLFISLTTSLVVYKGWWKGFIRLPRRTHAKLYWADIHRLLGVWSIWFIFIISVTSVWYLAEIWGARATYPEPAKPISPAAISDPVMPSIKMFEHMLTAQKQVYPDLILQRVFFPQKSGDAVIFQGQAQAILVRKRANAVSFDPVSGDVLSIYRGTELSTHARISEAADPLHFGTFAGLPSKILYFIFGLILSALAISGTYICGMRLARINRNEQKSARQIWAVISNKLSWFRIVSVSLLTVCSALTCYIFLGFYQG